MPFCANCGVQVDGQFCPKCGAAIVAGGSAPRPLPSSGPLDAEPVSVPMADNVASALCYSLGLLTGVVFLVLQPYAGNRAIRFHAYQSILVTVTAIVLDVLLAAILPAAGTVIGLFWTLFRLACFLLWLYLMLSAYRGKTVVLPYLGPLAENQAR